MNSRRRQQAIDRRRRRAAASRRGRGPSDRGWQVTGVFQSAQPAGPNINSASLQEVLEAANGLGEELSWAELAPRLLPLFERVRPYPVGALPRVQALVPPGLTVGLGIDIGPAFVAVTPQLLESWSVSVGDALAQAMANLQLRATEVQPDEVHAGDIGGLPTRWLQTDCSIGSMLLLLPADLSRLYGPGPRLFIAPMRDLLIGLPPGELEHAAYLYAEIASEDPNHLAPLAYHFDGRGITVEDLAAIFGPADAGAPPANMLLA